MKRLFRASAGVLIVLAACDGHSNGVVDPVESMAAIHVPGEPTTVHSVGVQLDGNVARVIWHVDPFNLGSGYTVEVLGPAGCTGSNLVSGGNNVSGQPWTELHHLFIEVGPLSPGDYCARVKSNGLYSPPSFRTFITVNFTVGTANSPPEISLEGPDEALEGSMVSFLAVAEDPDGDPLTIEWSIDGTPAATGPSFDTVFEDDGVYEVGLFVSDSRGASATATLSVTVTNVPPALLTTLKRAAGSTVNSVPVGQPVEISGTFTDPGQLDTHTLELNCDFDGTPFEGTGTQAVQPQYSGICEWSSPGTYRVGITVRDDDGGSDDIVSDPVIVYLPGVGDLTGGGWIDSPVGACQLTPMCLEHEGKASFGFVAKYRNGGTTPTGNLTFQLLPSGITSPGTGPAFTFRADALLLLSVVGQTAWLEGTGRFDGQDGYEFMLMAVDGKGSGGSDRFRLRISDRTSGALVYDSQPGEPLSAARDLSGGSIAIHGTW